MPTSVSLGQMVDLSLGTPEIGAVNFNVMHSLLHAILRKLNISDVKADIDEHDREFLATSKIRARSTLSDADSGRGEESEDGFSEKSVPPFRPSPYHRMEIKVEKLAQQLEQLNQLPSNTDLFARTTKSKESSDTPVADMWQYMQMKKRVDANEEGIGKLFSLIEDMMKQMKELKDENKALQDKLKALDLSDLYKRLNDLETITAELNDQFGNLPTPEEFAAFVTWPDLEAALKGLRSELEPQETEMHTAESQTEARTPTPTLPTPARSRPSSSRSRPGSSRSRPLSRLSSGSTGPSSTILDILERLGKLDEEHAALKERVDQLEEAIKGLDVSSDLLEQLGKLKAELDALASQRDKSTPANPYAILSALLEWSIKLTQPKIGDDDTSEDIGNIFQESDLTLYSELDKRFSALEDRFKAFQEALLTDSAYAGSSDVTDLTSWLGQMETKIAGHFTEGSGSDISDLGSEKQETEKVESEKPAIEKEEQKEPEDKKEGEKSDKEKEEQKKLEERKEKKEKREHAKKKQEDKEIEERQEEEKEISEQIERILAESMKITAGTMLSPELQATNERLKNLAQNLNEQLHSLRDKVFLLDHELKRMAKGVEFALLRVKFAGGSEMDSDALSRAQQAILQLQAEVEKLHSTTSDIIDENKIRTKEIQDLLAYCDRLQQQKADKDYVQMEVGVKADKKALDGKVNHKLFDQTTDEINKMIKEILDKLAEHEADWKTAYGKLTEDIDGKLDRLELDPLKEWLEQRLKALNDKLRKYQTQVDINVEDDAAGIRKQLIQRFHCISCDRPVDMMPTGPQPSLPAQSGLPPTRSPRPYTTFELEQIRQHAKSCLSGRNAINYERALAMKQLASLKKADLRAYLIHFKQDFEAASRDTIFAGGAETIDYYATPRPCGGAHTLTYPHKRNTKLTHLSHLFREEEGVVIPIPKEEVDVQGVDGHIYKGRSDMIPPRPPRLEARLPTQLGANNNNLNVNQRPLSPQPPQTRKTAPVGKSPLITQRTRPASARVPGTPPRPASAGPDQPRQGSRPQSAKVVQSLDESRLEAGEPEPQPQEAFVDEAQDHIDDVQQAQRIQMPSADETGQ